MKNNKNIFAIILSTFILISCSDPNETVEEISNDNMKNYTNPFESEGRASSQSINPYEEIGVAHNAVLYDLEKVDVQSNMKEGYAQVVSFLSDNYGIDEEKFISYEEAEQDLNAAVNNGYEFYVSIKNSSKDDHVSEVLENLENIILFSTNSDVFNVKIDNLVHVAHNVTIGKNTAIAACVGIAGSTSIGENCTIGGGSGLNGHICIADNVHIHGMTMVTKSIKEAGMYASGTTVEPADSWRKNQARFKELDALAKSIKKKI
jgi:hypothetical protein